MNNLYRANYAKKRGANTPHAKNTGIKKYTNNTIHSLNEVGCFLNNFIHFLKYVKIFKLFK